MRVAVLGASGRTGRRVVELALAAGHGVTALVRDPARLPLDDARLRVVAGDVLAADGAARAVRGSDAVISALGVPDAAAPGTVLSDGMRRVVRAMRALGVGRILAVGSAGILDDEDGGLRRDRPDFPAEYQAVTREHEGTWRALREGGVGWTLVCPPDLTTSAPTGRARARRDRLPHGGCTLAVGDLADFLVANLDGDAWTGARVGLAE